MLLWIAYAVGGVGMLVEWRAYLLHCGKAFRYWSAIAALLWSQMYALLDAWTAALTMGSTALRTLVSARLTTSSHKHMVALGFIVLFMVLTLISWQGVVSLLPAFAVINTTLALFYLNNRHMRIALLGSSFAWIVNDIVWQAWPALIAETVAMCINAITIIKLNRSTH